MSGVVMVAPERFIDTGAWFRIERDSSAGAVRRAAEALARQMQFDGGRVADVAIVAAELATNLIKHADDGALLLRPLRHESCAGVELISIDSGPGMADLALSARDGHSTAGTLGIGLGAIARQASRLDGYSRPGRGTVLAVQIWPQQPEPPAWAGGLVRPLTGETVSGDGFAVRQVAGRRQVLVSDGLGHGPLAAAATAAAISAFHTAPAAGPAQVVEHLHRAMSHTRGAAVAVAELDSASATLRYAGLGNITGRITGDGTSRGLVSLPGIAGHQRRSVREYDYPLGAGALLVMHSDGVADRWQLDDYPGLLGHSPVVIAATVLRDAGVRRDDACVVVVPAKE
ncbi:ATP-binding SpoIIE family protein phosphatase [Melissospora conviva]|uniref:ATP-binding SpoIIE family protein phosphatase n=1 Tax=Melissospora conviva TaxID=3388432 RepID=UPI003C2A7B84